MTPANRPKRRRTRSNSRAALWNVLTILVLLAIPLVVVVAVIIYLDPTSSLNPYPPPTLPATMALPVAVNASPAPAGETLQAASATPAVTPTATATAQPSATYTLAASDTPAPTPTHTPTATEAPTDPPIPGQNLTPTRKASRFFSFVAQSEPKALDASIFRAEHTCDWMGVAGQAIDLQGSPVHGIQVQVGGSINKQQLVPITSLTGTARWYGESGYEITLPSKPINSTDKLWVRLLDQSGIQISEMVFFNTYADCQRNLTVVNFKQIRQQQSVP